MDNIEMCKHYLLKPLRMKYRYLLKKWEGGTKHGNKHDVYER